MFVLKLKWEQKSRLWQDFDDGFLAFWPDLEISDVWFLYTNICSFSSFFFFSNGNLVDFVCAIFYSTLNKAGGEGAEPGFLQCQNTLCSTTTLITKS